MAVATGSIPVAPTIAFFCFRIAAFRVRLPRSPVLVNFASTAALARAFDCDFGGAVTVFFHDEYGGMDGNSDHRFEPTVDKKTYSPPVLQRLGTLKDLTQSIGHKGNKDGQQTGNQKRTSW